MNQLLKSLTITNYRDKTYRSVLISCLLIMILIGDILNQALNYITLHLPAQSTDFINYATWANIAPSLPFMLSILISYAVNNLRYRKLTLSVFILSLCGCLLLVSLSVQQFFLLSIIIAFIGFMYRAVYFSLDRQLSVILVDRIYDFQGDILLWGSLLGAINIKLSSYLYTHYQLTGLAIYFAIGNCLLYYFLRQIPPVDVVEQQITKQKALLNPIQVISVLVKFPRFMVYILIMAIFMLIGGSSNLLLMTKIHQEQIVLDTYTTLLSFSMLISVVSAMVSKINLFRHLQYQYMLALFLLISSGLTMLMALSPHVSVFAISFILLSGLNGIIFINMNSLLFEHIRQDNKLISLSPLINGLIASLFYGVSLLGQLGTNIALHFNIGYGQIYLICALAMLVLSFGLFYLKSPQNTLALNEA